MTPIFLFALPYSGSKRLVRLLGAMPGIQPLPAAGFMLPLCFSTRNDGVEAAYGHRWLRRTLEGFIGTLPDGKRDYLRALGEGGRRLYQAASPEGARYCLDATPRYHLIIDELTAAFPEAPLLFLWRHPAAVAGELLAGRAALPGTGLLKARSELCTRLQHLIRGQRRHRARAIQIQYETLSDRPRRVLAQIGVRLGLDLPPAAAGREAAEPAPEPAAAAPAGPLGRFLCRRYLDWIGPDWLAEMGYGRDGLQLAPDGLRRAAAEDGMALTPRSAAGQA
jgi:hypothetical protein